MDQIKQIAETFGVDGPRLISQIISFCIVCVLLYFLAYKRVLAMLKLAAQYYEYVLWKSPAGEPGRRLLESRRVGEETARRFQLGYTREHPLKQRLSRLRNRHPKIISVPDHATPIRALDS